MHWTNNKWGKTQPYSSLNEDHVCEYLPFEIEMFTNINPKWNSTNSKIKFQLKNQNEHGRTKNQLKTTKQCETQLTTFLNESNPSLNNWGTNVSWIMRQGSMPTMEELKDRRKGIVHMTNKSNKNYIIIKRFVRSIFSIYYCRMMNIFSTTCDSSCTVYSGVLPTNSYHNLIVVSSYTLHLKFNIKYLKFKFEWKRSDSSTNIIMIVIVIELLWMVRWQHWFDRCYLFYGIYFWISLKSLFLNIRSHSISVWSVANFLRCFISILVFSSIINCDNNCPCDIHIVSWI